MPEGAIPFSTIQWSWPSVYSWISLSLKSGTGGDIWAAKGTPVAWPSRPWHIWQWCWKCSPPSLMASGLEAMGFFFSLSPMVTVRLTLFMIEDSTSPGWLTLPADSSRMQNSINSVRDRRRSFEDRNGLPEDRDRLKERFIVFWLQF